MQRAIEAGSEAAEAEDPVFISGERNLLGVADLSANMDELRELFDLFEHKTRLMQLLDVSSRANGVQIYIGGESSLVPLDEMQRGDRALRGRRQGRRHAGRHRADAHGLRARDPDRRHHGEAAVERAEPRVAARQAPRLR